MCLGVPGQVVSVSLDDRKVGIVNIGGVRREVNLACVLVADEPLGNLVGEWVLVHVGFAMSRMDQEEAEKTLQLLRELGEVQETLAAMSSSDAALGEKGQ
jgi:hydrogenase expression/formation protein HypC